MQGPVILELLNGEVDECATCGGFIYYEKVLVGRNQVRAQWKHSWLANEYCNVPTGFPRARPIPHSEPTINVNKTGIRVQEY